MATDWLVQFSFYDSAKKIWVLKIFKKGINYITKYKDRLATANALKASLIQQLEKGWNPLTGTMPIDQVISPLKNHIA
jgi:hypothetical protein